MQKLNLDLNFISSILFEIDIFSNDKHVCMKIFYNFNYIYRADGSLIFCPNNTSLTLLLRYCITATNVVISKMFRFKQDWFSNLERGKELAVGISYLQLEG